MTNKNNIRRAALARRDAFSSEARIEASLALLDHADHPLLDLPGETVVAGYHPIRSEIDPRPLLDVLRRRGVRLCLPAVVSGSASDHERHRGRLEFRALERGDRREAELVSAGFGTLAPPDTAAIVTPRVLLVPLAAFDRTGGRLGYGAGHYDGALAALPDATAIGIAFAGQEVEAVPQEPHDRRLDAILTEREVIVPRADATTTHEMRAAGA